MDQNWRTYGVCDCGYQEEAPFGSLHHIHTPVCPVCGEPRWRWSVKVRRRDAQLRGYVEKVHISESVWYKPWTWGRERVEERPVPKRERKQQ